MKAIDSPLQIKKINITGCQMVMIPRKSVNDTLNNFNINVDIESFNQKNDSSEVLIQMTVSGNDIRKPVPGYCFNIFCDGTFYVSPEVDEKIRTNLFLYSATQMIIGYVRGFLSNITSYADFDQYILPALDLNDLIINFVKSRNVENEKKKKTNTKRPD